MADATVSSDAPLTTRKPVNVASGPHSSARPSSSTMSEQWHVNGGPTSSWAMRPGASGRRSALDTDRLYRRADSGPGRGSQPFGEAMQSPWTGRRRPGPRSGRVGSNGGARGRGRRRLPGGKTAEPSRSLESGLVYAPAAPWLDCRPSRGRRIRGRARRAPRSRAQRSQSSSRPAGAPGARATTATRPDARRRSQPRDEGRASSSVAEAGRRARTAPRIGDEPTSYTDPHAAVPSAACSTRRRGRPTLRRIS